MLSNGSSVCVSVSMRSATVQYLLITELGFTSIKHPDRANEIISGAIEALHPGMILFIESTAEGSQGKHHDYCKIDMDLEKSGRKLTKLDRKFFFYAWFDDPKNVLDEPVPINKRMREYFEKIEGELVIALSDEQKWFYVKKDENLGENVKRQYPSTPKEAFEASIEGSYFSRQFAKIREQRRICAVPVVESALVDTWWDLGLNDVMAIWFTQDIGREIHVVDYEEGTGEGFPFYKDLLDEKGYCYGRMVAPHDISVHELGTGKSRWQAAQELGINFEHVPRVSDKMNSIDAARKILSICYFDEENCDTGIQRLENYRKKWDDLRGAWMKAPVHDINSNGADAFQTLAMGHDFAHYSQSGRARTIERVRFPY